MNDNINAAIDKFRAARKRYDESALTRRSAEDALNNAEREEGEAGKAFAQAKRELWAEIEKGIPND